MVRRSVAAIVYLLFLAAVVVAQPATLKKTKRGSALPKNCSGLHAGIRAQIISPNTETPSVMLSFLLLNDSATPVDVEARSWRIVVTEAN
jgi:hypothetical protein